MRQLLLLSLWCCEKKMDFRAKEIRICTSYLQIQERRKIRINVEDGNTANYHWSKWCCSGNCHSDGNLPLLKLLWKPFNCSSVDWTTRRWECQRDSSDSKNSYLRPRKARSDKWRERRLWKKGNHLLNFVLCHHFVCVQWIGVPIFKCKHL